MFHAPFPRGFASLLLLFFHVRLALSTVTTVSNPSSSVGPSANPWKAGGLIWVEGDSSVAPGYGDISVAGPQNSGDPSSGTDSCVVFAPSTWNPDIGSAPCTQDGPSKEVFNYPFCHLQVPPTSAGGNTSFPWITCWDGHVGGGGATKPTTNGQWALGLLQNMSMWRDNHLPYSESSKFDDAVPMQHAKLPVCFDSAHSPHGKGVCNMVVCADWTPSEWNMGGYDDKFPFGRGTPPAAPDPVVSVAPWNAHPWFDENTDWLLQQGHANIAPGAGNKMVFGSPKPYDIDSGYYTCVVFPPSSWNPKVGFNPCSPSDFPYPRCNINVPAKEDGGDQALPWITCTDGKYAPAGSNGAWAYKTLTGDGGLPYIRLPWTMDAFEDYNGTAPCAAAIVPLCMDVGFHPLDEWYCLYVAMADAAPTAWNQGPTNVEDWPYDHVLYIDDKPVQANDSKGQAMGSKGSLRSRPGSGPAGPPGGPFAVPTC